MARIRNSAARNEKLTSRQIRKRKRQKAALCMLAAVSCVATVISHIAPHFTKQKMHTSILTGEGWIQELLNGFFLLKMLFKILISSCNL